MTITAPSGTVAVAAMPANHRTVERQELTGRIRDGAVIGGMGGALFGGVFGVIGGALALGFSTEGLPVGVSRASRIPAALKQLGGWGLGSIAVGVGIGAGVAAAWNGMRALNERFHL